MKQFVSDYGEAIVNFIMFVGFCGIIGLLLSMILI